jgi:hypothetical protein
VTAVAAELVVAVVQWYWSRRWFDGRAVAGGFARVLVAAVVSCVAMTVLVHAIFWPLAVLIGLIVYAVLALAVGAISRDKLREVMGAVRGGGGAQPA